MEQSHKEIIQYLARFVTAKRFEQFEKIVKYRTRYITVAIEDVYQSHNASAVLRTCECFGIQDVHVIENKNKYTINPDVALGSSKWIHLIRHNKKENNSLEAIRYLKNMGYRIIATTPHKKESNLEDIDITKGKFVLFFGTELKGLSAEVIQHADEYLMIPMYGFTESYNISVSAAIILHYLTYALRNSSMNWQLTGQEQEDILLDWLRQSIKRSDLLEKEFLESRKGHTKCQ